MEKRKIGKILICVAMMLVAIGSISNATATKFSTSFKLYFSRGGEWK